MVLNRTQVVDGACAMLDEQGLGGLSMRRLAQDLGVKPGALYYHVASKQDLLVEIAGRILEGRPISTVDARRAAHDIRDALLRVRDGAEVVSFALAFRPDALPGFRELHGLFAARHRSREAGWAARTLVRYVLGFVAEEQNYAELVGTTILDDVPARAEETDDAFRFGVEALVRGLDAVAEQEDT
ncbi:TetR family transcriptional regulator [Pseudonocardia endophytica]|uniref:TetR family transcriptional regulator n=1 Tax=Pseudonocardia endophytica TaxID=401976 RepID=A0A4R1HZ66_PSEEN|nr:TetR family transcriptional regulator [Pseudonocardia endophytica]TCK26861.1 TetR family transcriptional regulator [Pseudonocardia endophytica]